jgi:TatD DNase family protein
MSDVLDTLTKTRWLGPAHAEFRHKSPLGVGPNRGCGKVHFVLFDTHCHFDFDAFASGRDAFLRRAGECGITKMLVPGVSPSSWERQARVIAECRLYGAFGIHPFWAHEVGASDLETVMRRLEHVLAEGAAVAVGECGLDRARVSRGAAPLAWQATVLERQLRLAQSLRLPVILHCVRAHGLLLRLLDEVGPLPAGGVLHAYSGSAELIARYVQHGMYFGFGGAVTRPGFEHAKLSLSSVPIERLVLETDAPDQSPAWLDGPNQPAELARIADVIADLRGVPSDILGAQTTENAARLFGL